MRKIIVVFLAVAVGCSPKTEDQSADANITAVENSLIRQVHFEGDSLWSIEDRMKHYGVPGVSIAVIKDNKIAWSKAYGIMDKETKEPVTTKTLFQAGSISKPVAAYGALKTVEMGKVSLTGDANKYLKTWKIPDNEFTNNRKVTLEHLLSHTGGLTVHGFLGYSPDLPVPTLVQLLDGAAPANSPPVRVDKEPGSSFRYSGGGYSIMQQMLIDVHGKTFPEIEKELVLGPLGMNNSTYDQPLDAATVKMAATGYLPDHTQTKGKRHTYPEMAAAGLWTTAEDLAKFAIDIQLAVKGRSVRVLSMDMAERMLTPFDGGFIGLGIFIDNRKGDVYFGHGGWDEGFSSEMKAHKEKGYGVVVLTNSNQPAFIGEVIRSVARAYSWDNFVPEYKKLPLDTSVVKTIAGRYFNGSDGGISITSQDGRLFFKYLRAEHPDELFRISENEYITAFSDSEVQFETKKDGEVALYIAHGEISAETARRKLKDKERVPYEYLLEGDFNKALKGYKDLLKTKDKAVEESNLNGQGYQLLEDGKGTLAQDVFKINTILYPNSYNVYDSYADACKANGDNKEAIANYKKALKLNPKNEETAKKLAELENISK
ncbi:MAG TPA: serine hydrolase [Cyclobacteriaceae bacterium]|nr:serine hydrolase [Cyclobacteriaceae bacterium]